MFSVTQDILQSLYKGDASCLTSEVIYNINQIVLNLLSKEPLTEVEINIVGDILHISNIIYNNTIFFFKHEYYEASSCTCNTFIWI